MNRQPVGVPDGMRQRCAEITALTDPFCKRHLDGEYAALCREMTALLCRSGAPVKSGKAAGWAAGVVYSIGWVNFLGDPSQPHHMKADDMARLLGVSPATLAAKARVIRSDLDLNPLDPRWTVRSRLEHNPMVWLAEVNGVPVDLRKEPRPIQEEAYRRGLIPFIPVQRG
jgi:hypothetical protein